MKAMQKRLEQYDVVQWVNDFLEQLQKSKNEQKRQQVKLLTPELTVELRHKYNSSEKRCILLDYDGTLAPLVRLPADAYPSNELLSFLQTLSADKKNEIFIISGRDADTLQNWMGHLPLNFIAEHGALIKYKGGEWESQSTAPGNWKNEIRPMLESYVFRCAGSFIEEKKHAITWHYRNTHPGLGFIRSRELINNLLLFTNNSPVQVIDGNKVVEVRMTGLDKGITALKVIDKVQPDFILCVGDDTTDEDMFKALQDKGCTIKIGTGPTAAKYNIATQAEVLDFLVELTT